MEVIKLNTKRVVTDENYLVIEDDVKVKINYFWDSDDGLVRFPYHGKYSKTYNGAHVVIYEQTYDFYFDDKLITKDGRDWKISIDGQTMCYDVYSYSVIEYEDNTKTIVVKAIVGGS